MTWASELGIIADGTDCAPDFIAALEPGIQIEFEPGLFLFGSQVALPSGASVRGCGMGTQFSPLPSFTPRTHLTNALLTTEPNSEDVTVSSLRFDGLGIGTTSETRIHGLVMRRTLNFDVSHILSENWSGYACWLSGDDPASSGDRHCSGLVTDYHSRNSDVLFEASLCNGVTLRNCHGDDGARTINCEDAFLAWHGAENVTFEDCTYTGRAGTGLAVISNGQKEVKNIIVRRCDFRTENTFALGAGYQTAADKPFRIGLTVEDSKFASARGNCLSITNVDGAFRRCDMSGFNVGGGLGGGVGSGAIVLFEDVELLASNDPNGASGAYGLYLDDGSAATVTRGALRARGKLPQAYIKALTATINLSPQTILEP